jgi:transcriptional regulator with XRE-family HTH domain
MNWKQLLTEIQDLGNLSQSEIGERVGRSQGWVSAALRGNYQDLRWSDGDKILKLHSKVVKKTRKAA